MEFKFRAVDRRPANHLAHPPLPSATNFFPEEAFRASFSAPNLRPIAELIGWPNYAYEALHRDLEKEQIRKEIIEGEITRRRILEAEVMRELMMEQEMAILRALLVNERLGMRFEPRLPLDPPIEGEITRRRILEAEVMRELMMDREMAILRASGAQGLSVNEHLGMRFEPRLPLAHPIEGEITRRRILEAEAMRELMMEQEMAMLRASGTDGLSVNERLGMHFEPRLPLAHPFKEQIEGLTSPGCSAFPRLQEARANEMKPKLKANKDKLIVLANPKPNLCGMKRKAETPPAVRGSLVQSIALKNTPNEELSCAICRVNVTSKKGLFEHLQGKKHKVKKASLMANKMSTSSSTVRLLKKIKHSKPTKTTGSARSALEVKTKSYLLQDKETEDSLHQEMRTTEDLNNKSCTLPLPQKLVEKPTCLVRITSKKGLTEHLQGKKHKVKKASLMANKMSTSSRTVPLLKKIKSSKPTETPGSASSAVLVKTKSYLLQNKETEDCLHQEMRTNKSCKLPLLQKLVEKPKKKNKARMEETGGFKKKHIFKFWCEMCQIGAYSQNVMDDHKKGLKHMAQLQELSITS